MNSTILPSITDSQLRTAAEGGMDEFLKLITDSILEAIGGELNADTMQHLNSDQITLLAYRMLHEEVMDGGFVQLIHNGLGPFIFLNPFAKAMRQWGAKDFQKLIYDGHALYEKHGKAIEKPCSDDEFMALYEQYPEFEDLDDAFIEDEEQITEIVAHYVDEHLNQFIKIEG